MVSTIRGLIAISVILLFLSVAYAVDLRDYRTGKTFSGDGTYYGPGGWEGGNCAIRSPRPRFYNKYMPIAVNTEQYDGMCGACIEYWGHGHGAGANPITGRHKGVIVDRCPECKYGDIDLSVRGDGRWKVFWKVVPCQGDWRVSFQFEGSNQHYWKLQPRGMKSPPVKVVVGGVKAYRTQDNHWIAEKNFKPPVKVVVTSILGEHYVSYLSRWSGIVYGGSQSGKYRKKAKKAWKKSKKAWKKSKKAWKKAWKKAKKRAKKRAKKGKKYGFYKSRRGVCVKKWHACSGPNNAFGTSHCCGGFWCVKAPSTGFIGRRCEPPAIKRRPRRCVRKWNACSGPNNKSGTSHCCGGFWCVKASSTGFIGRRCEPPAVKRRPRRCVRKWNACTGPNNKSGTSNCCSGFWCVKSSQATFIGNRCEPPTKKPVVPVLKCRKHYATCGKYRKWVNKFGELYSKPRCCRPDANCKWVNNLRYRGFRCIPRYFP